ncbi:MAG: DMT family transporter [bacterium]
MEGGSRAATIAVIIAMFAYAWAAILIRWAQEASPLVIAFYRMLIGTVVWAPFYFIHSRGTTPIKITGRQWRYMLLAGLGLCFHFATWITSISYTTVASAVFLIMTQPIMVAVAAHFILRERLNRISLVAMGMTVIGAFLIFGGDFSVSQRALFGDFLALLGAMGAGVYLFIARIVRPDREGGEQGVPLTRYLPVVYATATVGLGLLALIRGDRFGPFQPQTWWAMLALGLVPQVIGHSLLNWALKYLPALQVNITLVGEPIGASILAFLLLQESPSAGLLVGSPFLILAVFLIFRKPPKTVEMAAQSPL